MLSVGLLLMFVLYGFKQIYFKSPVNPSLNVEIESDTSVTALISLFVCTDTGTVISNTVLLEPASSLLATIALV